VLRVLDGTDEHLVGDLADVGRLARAPPVGAAVRGRVRWEAARDLRAELALVSSMCAVATS
jgi:hypothetical protein